MRKGTLTALLFSLSTILGSCDSPTKYDPPDPEPASVEIISPNEGEEFKSGSDIPCKAEVSNPGNMSTTLSLKLNGENVTCSSGTLDTNPGIGNHTLVAEISGETQDSDQVHFSVIVNVSYATFDREDDKSGNQIHVLYTTPKDGEVREDIISQKIPASLLSTQNWLENKTGKRLVLDTHQGNLDITLLRMSISAEEMKEKAREGQTGAFIPIAKELENAGFDQPNKIYAVYYDGELSDNSSFCGLGGRNGGPAISYITHCPPTWSENPPEDRPGTSGFRMLHEIFHSLDAVHPEAPNHNNGHVNDHPGDLMYLPGPDDPPGKPTRYVDYGRDDYFGKNVPEGVNNIAHSPYLSN